MSLFSRVKQVKKIKVLENYGKIHDSDVVGNPKPEGDDPDIEYPRPQKVEPEPTPTVDFNYRTPKPKGTFPKC